MDTKSKLPRAIWPVETAKDRLKQFIEFKGLNNSRFEKMCGLSNGYVNNLKHRPSRLKIEQIVKVFPDLNYMWLINGKGHMIETEEDKKNREELISKEEEIMRFMREIERLKKEIELRDELIESMRETIALYREKVSVRDSVKKEDTFTVSAPLSDTLQ